jgi:recombination protein RecT
MTESPLAKREEKAALIESAIQSMVTAWPKSDASREQFAAIATSVAISDPVLAECSMKSKLLALNEVCRLGLIPDRHLGHVYLVPLKIRGVKEVQVWPGYKGWMELARRSGRVNAIESGVVYESDEFDFEFGTSKFLKHRPHWMINPDSEPGRRRAAWCTSLVDGEVQIEVMSAAQVLAIKNRSAGAKRSDSPWHTDEDAMWRKTVVKKARHMWPLSTEIARLSQLDDAIDDNRPQDLASLSRAVKFVETESPELESSDDAGRLGEPDASVRPGSETDFGFEAR